MTAPNSIFTDSKELIAAALRHADGITSQLAKPDWKPGRAHIEQARNSIKKLADMLGAAQAETDRGALTESCRAHVAETALREIRRYSDENSGPSRSSLLNKIAATADAALALSDGLPGIAYAERNAVIEECAQVAEAEKKTFLSPEYASNQPLGSLCERFACDQVAEAIRALAIPATPRETLIGGTNFCGHGMMASICPTCSVTSTHGGTEA